MKNPPQVGDKVFWYRPDGVRQTRIVENVRDDGKVVFQGFLEVMHYRALAGRIVKKERRVWWVHNNSPVARGTSPPENEKHLWIKVVECRKETG